MKTHRSLRRRSRWLVLALAAFVLASFVLPLARADDSRLVNLSTRAQVGTGENILIAGFVIPAGSAKTVLVRAAGPTLTSYGLTSVIANPKISIVDSTGTTVASNDDWDSSLSTTFSALGAFSFTSGSKDAALKVTLSPGAYTALVSGSDGGTGVGLVEVYEVDSTNNLINISTRGYVGTGEAVMISGFVVASGTNSRLLLLRAAGPAISSMGISGVLSNPKLTLYNSSGTKIAENDDWGTPVTVNDATSSELSTAFTKAGAFTFSSASKDAAMLVGLPPAAYTVQVSGVSSTTGVALAEIYDVSSYNLSTTAPAITTQPSSVSVASGSSATFSVTATGTAVLSYQWYKDGTAISGATSSSYTISSAASANGGSYAVAISNIAGNTTSTAATLTITTSGGSSGGGSSALSATVTTAAQTFLATLTSTQLSTTQISWDLATARRWSNLPAAMVSRNGVSWSSLSTTQKTAASALISSALSSAGNTLWVGMQAADDYLAANGGGSTYGAGQYYIAILGTPSASSFWMLQLTGHHLTYNIAFNGTYKSPTPLFLGVEPKGSFTQSGTTYDPMLAQRTAMADLASTLGAYSSAMLSGSYTDLLFGANGSGNIDSTMPKSYPTGTSGRGVLYSSLASTDQDKIKAVIRSYVNTQATEYADDLLGAYLSDSALAQTYVAYASSSSTTTKGSYFRVDGPRVWIEFSVQGGVIFSSDIHYHSIWRDKSADYGGNF